ncbi:hypothetical protein [Streptomyces antimycoticus]|uniref:hypothetical protein n=1 Tax=Streptomyces antimycoticus TaxID=68175 RepID=UPI00343A1418
MAVELTVSEGVTRRAFLKTPEAEHARRIANYLPATEWRECAQIVDNEDAELTGIQFHSVSGPLVLKMPEEGAAYEVILLSETGPETVWIIPGGKRGEVSPQAIAYRLGNLLRELHGRGFI